jgi:alkylation response protein AidB-like acyl-CoA dehydrogenase
VYFTDVRIPSSEMLGQPGQGWRVIITTLMNERTAIGGAIPLRGSGPIGTALALWGTRPPADRADPVRRDRLLRLWIEAEVGRLNNMRAAANRKVGAPGPEGSIGKLAGAELNQRIFALCIDLLGADGLVGVDYAHPFDASGAGGTAALARHAFLRSRANTIEGGTSEIMRNILGERVLGLPGDVRVDRDVPWNQVPRG